jgi:hypothetical protein
MTSSRRPRAGARYLIVMDAHFDLTMDMDDRRKLGESKVYSFRHSDLVRAEAEIVSYRLF